MLIATCPSLYMSLTANTLYRATFITYKKFASQYLCQLRFVHDEKDLETAVQKLKKNTDKRNRLLNPKITLIGTDENISVITLQEAEKLAKRRDLKLMKVSDLDDKAQRPLYKLLTSVQIFEEDQKQKELKKPKTKSGFKGEKLLPLSSKIAEHDLMEKVKKIDKWIEKNHEVRIVVTGLDGGIAKCESIYDTISSNMKCNGRIVQKRFHGKDLKFQIIPPKKEQKDNNKEQKDNNKE